MGPVAEREKIIGLTLILDYFDRCHSLASLYLPPAALSSLPLFESHLSPCKNPSAKAEGFLHGVGDGIRTHEYRNHNPVP